MAGKDADELCHRWIVEYDCWRMWSRFSEFGSVDGIPNRATCTINPKDHGDDVADRYRLLVSFMCKISEAANEESADVATEHDVTTPQTTVEEAIDLFDDISRCYRGMVESGELNDVKLCLKCHAVLAPLRRNDRTLVKAVCDRQWREWKNAEEMNFRTELLSLVDSDSLHLKRQRSFKEVVVKCQGLLEKIMSTMSKPFLVEAAQHVCEKVKDQNAFVSALQLSPAKSVEQKSPRKSPAKCVVPQQISPQKSPAKRNVPHSAETCVVTIDKLPEKDEQKSKAVKSPAKLCAQSAATNSASEKTKSMENSESEVEVSDDSFEMNGEEYWHPTTKRVKNPGVKKRWSEVEEELVYKGVQAHGVGNWAMIHSNFLRYRSNVDIKDKWRTMIRQGRLKKLAHQFGPLT